VKNDWVGQYYNPYESLAAPMTENTTYYWQVVADDGTDTTASPVWSFNTAIPVDANAFHYSEHIADETYFGAHSIYAADMDGDGDVDVIGSGDISSAVTWWENDGTTNFENWPNHNVESSFTNPSCNSAHAADVDGDGDMDLLGAVWQEDAIVWWENDGSNDGASWTEHIIDDAFDGPTSIYGSDIDGDGDTDILGAAYLGDSITYWENGGASGEIVWIAHTIDAVFNTANWVTAKDMDGDGDVDVIGSGGLDNWLFWWENDGTNEVVNWTAHQIESVNTTVSSVCPADVNGDGDMDLVGALVFDDEVVWWENDGTNNVTNWTEHTVDELFDGAGGVYAADVDGDGDIDVLGSAWEEDAINWWENSDGAGTSWTEHVVDGAFVDARSVYAADVNGDGYTDILGAGDQLGGIVWWEITENNLPGPVALISPENGETSVPVSDTLVWSCNDLDGDDLRYTILMDSQNDPGTELSVLEEDTFIVFIGIGFNTTYYWQVIADDGHGGTDTSDVWSFTTVENQPPDKPVAVTPVDQATDIPVEGELVWSGSDPEDHSLTFTVFFDTSNPPMTEYDGLEDTLSYQDLQYNTVYYWRVDADDGHGGITEGDVWSFTTEVNDPPLVFDVIGPVDEAAIHERSIPVSWHSTTDPEGHAITYLLEWSLDPAFTDEVFSTILPTADDTTFTITELANPPQLSVGGSDDSLPIVDLADEELEFRDLRAVVRDRSTVSGRSKSGSSLRIPGRLSEELSRVSGSAKREKQPSHMSMASLTVNATGPEIPDDTTLYWRVKALDELDAETWSSDGDAGRSVNLDIYEPPEPFSLTEPVKGSVCYSLDTTFSWQESVDPDPYDVVTYQLWMGQQPDLSDAVLVEDNISATQTTVTELSPFSTYYWSVKASDTNTGHIWALDTLSFTTWAPVGEIQVQVHGNRFEWISHSYMPSDLSMSNLSQRLGANLQIVYHDDGSVYIPSLEIDQIEEIGFDRGLRVFVTGDRSLSISGVPVHPETEYTIPANRWTMLFNPLTEQTSAETALSGLLENMLVIQDDDGLVWAPDQTVKTLNNLEPGEAYQVLLDTETTFRIGSSSLALAALPSKKQGDGKTAGRRSRLIEMTAAPSAPPSTGVPFNVFATVEPSLYLHGARTLELLDGDVVVGACLLPSGEEKVIVTAWGAVPDYELKGFTAGHSIGIRVLDQEGVKIPIKIDGEGLTYGESAYGQIELAEKVLPSAFRLGKIYPNPFNPVAYVNVEMPEKAQLLLEVYNVLGRRVSVLNDKVLDAGYHSLMIDGNGWASGIYFVRVHVPGQLHKVKKIVLLR
jgi:hypothetical protein